MRKNAQEVRIPRGCKFGGVDNRMLGASAECKDRVSISPLGLDIPLSSFRNMGNIGILWQWNVGAAFLGSPSRLHTGIVRGQKGDNPNKRIPRN